MGLPSFSANLLCWNVRKAREYAAQLIDVSKTQSTNHVSLFVNGMGSILHMSCFGDTIGRENWRLGLPRFSAKLIVGGISPRQGNIRPSWVMPVSHTTLTMLPCSSVRLESFYTCPLSVGTIGRENWRLGLPSFSAKLHLLECHQR